MDDASGETVPCHYCGAAIEVAPGQSRFRAFTTHFETEHIRGEGGGAGSPAAGVPDTGD